MRSRRVLQYLISLWLVLATACDMTAVCFPELRFNNFNSQQNLIPCICSTCFTFSSGSYGSINDKLPTVRDIRTSATAEHRAPCRQRGQFMLCEKLYVLHSVINLTIIICKNNELGVFCDRSWLIFSSAR